MRCRSISSPPEAKYRLLYVGADLGLLKFVQEALKADGWFVVRCPGGSLAGAFVRSEIHYDLLMFDEEFIGGSGRELLRLALSLEHRKQTPVMLLVQKECEAVARLAGVSVFLRKPEQFKALVEAVRRLIV